MSLLNDTPLLKSLPKPLGKPLWIYFGSFCSFLLITSCNQQRSNSCRLDRRISLLQISRSPIQRIAGSQQGPIQFGDLKSQRSTIWIHANNKPPPMVTFSFVKTPVCQLSKPFWETTINSAMTSLVNCFSLLRSHFLNCLYYWVGVATKLSQKMTLSGQVGQCWLKVKNPSPVSF